MQRREFLKRAGQTVLAAAAAAVVPLPAFAGTADEHMLGEICIFPYNFAPNGFALCEGQILTISSNTALFSLLGTNYGGNGKSNFALPDFRSADHAGYHKGLEFTPLRYYIAMQGIFPPRP